MNFNARKILVADDHNVVRVGIMKSLGDQFPDTYFQEASNASEVINFIQRESWDLIIMDISMPGRNGIEVLQYIKRNNPKIPVIIFSMYPEDQFALRAIKSGASAYLTKDISFAELALAARKVLNGEQYLTDSVARIITEELRQEYPKLAHETLSNREFEVLLLIGAGKAVSDIASELSLSVKTISVYRSNILRKMHLKNNSEIMHYVLNMRLIP